MRRILSFFIFVLIVVPLYAKKVIIEVSKKYPMTKECNNRIKMHSLKDAFDYCNNYKGNQGIEMVLKDDINIIDATLVLKKTSVPIIIRAKNGTSVITSGDIINDWYQKGDTLIIPMYTQCRKFVINGEDIPLANTFTPNESMKKILKIKKIDDYNYKAELSRDEIVKMEVGCDLFLYTRWHCYKLQVTEIDLQTNTVSLNTNGKKAIYATDNDVRYAIYNSRHVMQPGSFCWKDGYIYYLRKDSDDYSKIHFSIPTVSTLVKVLECKNITFQHVSFENAVMDEWYYQEIQGSALCSKAVLVEYSSEINFKDCEFHNNMGYSLAIGNHSSNCKVSGCRFNGLQGGGIILGMEGGDSTHDIIIDDNLIRGYGSINVCCEGILSQRANHVTITNNTICDGYYTGVSLGWTWGYDTSYSYNNYIARNHIHHLMKGILDDGGGIYTLGIQNGTIIENNYIHDIYPDKEMGCLIYLDEGSSELMVRNNICFSSKRGISESYGKNNIIEKNIIGIVDKWGIRLSYPNKDSNLIIRDNMFFTDADISIDSNIPEESLYNNKFLSSLYITDKRIEVYAFKKKKIYKTSLYGCKSRTLR